MLFKTANEVFNFTVLTFYDFKLVMFPIIFSISYPVTISVVILIFLNSNEGIIPKLFGKGWVSRF